MKVLLILGFSGEDVDVYVAETLKVDKLIPHPNDWDKANEIVNEHPNVFKLFDSVVEAIVFCLKNNHEIEEEVSFIVY